MSIFELFKSSKKKNLIFIVIDNFRNDWLSKYQIFSKLEEMGTFFNEMITYAPYTIASMHAYLSGIYGNHNGVDGYYKLEKFDKENIYTLAQYLKDNGYTTVADSFNKVVFPCYGFDELMFYDETTENFLVRHPQILNGLVKKGKPFFAYLHYPTIHRDIVKYVIKCFDDFDERYFYKFGENAKRYDSFTAQAVEYLEKMVSYINETELFNNSLVIVMTDHGCSIGERPGEKVYGIFTYEYSIKVWAYFIAPWLVKKNNRITSVVRTVDVMPTILDILKIKSKKKYMKWDGSSLMPALLGNDIPDRIAFCETGGVDGPHPSPFEANVKCIRTKEWKLIYNLTTKKKELYNIIKDPAEKNNLIGIELEKEKELWEKLVKI
ncbi:MAG: sulfatase-like hydrolase/transferase [Candidatus Hydrogenedentota bacterium]